MVATRGAGALFKGHAGIGLLEGADQAETTGLSWSNIEWREKGVRYMGNINVYI